jgi:hypothetical protein
VSTIGGDIIAGIVAGITGGAGAVINAIGGAVTGAIDHAEKLLGIKSPSKVFAKIGGYTAEGFAGGVEDGAPAAQDAMSSMVSPSDAKQAALSGDLGAFANIPSPADAPRAGAAPAASGAGVDLSHAVFQFYGVEGAADVEGRMGEILTKILEGKAAQLGTAPAGAFG